MGFKYEILFTVKIEHEFFNTSYLPLEFIPSSETSSLLKGLRAQALIHQNILTVVIPTQDNKAATPLSQGTNFRFYFRILDQRFNNVTGGLQLDFDKILYFSNLQSRDFGGKTYISTPISKYTKEQSYEHGDLATNATGTLHESLLTNSSGTNSKGLTNTTYWKKIESLLTYVSPSDQFFKANNVLNYRFEPLVEDFEFSIKKFNPTSGLFDIDALPPKNYSFSLPSAEASIGIDALPPSLYQANLNGSDVGLFFKDEVLFKNNFDGLIDISHHDLLPESGKLIHLDGTLKKPTFLILFKSRSLLWRYIIKNQGDVTSLLDINDDSVGFNPDIDNSFLSNKLLELQESSSRTIVLKKASIVKSFILQTPQAQTIKKIEKNNSTFLVSEVFINF